MPNQAFCRFALSLAIDQRTIPERRWKALLKPKAEQKPCAAYSATITCSSI
jgi:hypothetical protein